MRKYAPYLSGSKSQRMAVIDPSGLHAPFAESEKDLALFMNSEVGLIEDIRNGCEKAFGKVICGIQSSLLIIAKAITRDELEAEDIVMTAFTKCWERRGQFQSVYKLSAFCYVVVKHASLLFLEQQKKRKYIIQDVYHLQTKVEKPCLEKIVERERNNMLYKGIEKIPGTPQYAKVVDMYYLQNLSLSKISADLDIPIEIIRVHKQRGLLKLKSNLKAAVL